MMDFELTRQKGTVEFFDCHFLLGYIDAVLHYEKSDEFFASIIATSLSVVIDGVKRVSDDDIKIESISVKDDSLVIEYSIWWPTMMDFQYKAMQLSKLFFFDNFSFYEKDSLVKYYRSAKDS